MRLADEAGIDVERRDDHLWGALVRTFRGGARFNWLGGSWPFGRLGIDEMGVSIALFERTYFIRRSDIVELFETRYFPWRALQIRHRAGDVPDDLILCFPIRKRDRQAIPAALEDRGYRAVFLRCTPCASKKGRPSSQSGAVDCAHFGVHAASRPGCAPEMVRKFQTLNLPASVSID